MYDDYRNWVLRYFWLLSWILTGLAAALVVLVIADAILYSGNIDRRQAINDRQLYIQQGQQLELAYREIVNGLAELATTAGDKEIAALLESQGITLNTAQNPAVPAGNMTPNKK